MRIVLPLAAVCLALGCASQKPASQVAPAASETKAGSATLYDRLGGKGAIEAVVDEFLARVAVDERINAGFAGANLPKLRQRLVELICMASGGPCHYSGRDMKTAHAGMGITGAQADASAADLVAALDKFKVPPKEKGELLAIVGSLRGDIVEQP